MTGWTRQDIPRARSAVTEPVAAGMEAFAQSWASAIIGTSYVPMTKAEVVDHLRGLTALLVEALLADAFRTAAAHEVGIRLVEAHFTGTETRPVQDVGRSSLTGAATVILAGISIGFESAVYTAVTTFTPPLFSHDHPRHTSGAVQWRIANPRSKFQPR